MRRVTLSIRIRSDLKEKMSRVRDVDWRKEIEEFIERKIKEIELRRTLGVVDEILKNVSISEEPAWKSIREFRERR